MLQYGYDAENQQECMLQQQDRQHADDITVQPTRYAVPSSGAVPTNQCCENSDDIYFTHCKLIPYNTIQQPNAALSIPAPALRTAAPPAGCLQAHGSLRTGAQHALLLPTTAYQCCLPNCAAAGQVLLTSQDSYSSSTRSSGVDSSRCQIMQMPGKHKQQTRHAATSSFQYSQYAATSAANYCKNSHSEPAICGSECEGTYVQHTQLLADLIGRHHSSCLSSRLVLCVCWLVLYGLCCAGMVCSSSNSCSNNSSSNCLRSLQACWTAC